MNEQTIFTEALERTDPQQRIAFLDQACQGDPAQRQRIDRLLAQHQHASGFLDTPLFDSPPTIDPPATSGARQAPQSDEISLNFLAPCNNPESLGRIGPYEVTETIGRGGMGVVLKGHDAKLNRVVAIKVLAPELAANPTAKKRFLREAQAAAAVVHQHVVTIHAVDEDCVPYLVMEYIDGQSLQEKIDREGHLRLVEILRIGQQVAAGLTAAHAHGLMHRDVKPANILLENGVERVRITDFGLARAVDDVGITRTGEVAGTPQYMSPEQAQGLPMDARSDLFSLGCVLYAICTGRPPFRAETTLATVRRVCEDTPRPIREVNPEIPDWLVAIIDRLLAKSPADRFQTAAEVADLLSQHLAHLQHPSSAPLPVIVTTTKEKHRGPAKLHIRRLQRIPVALAVVALVCLAVSLGLAEATGVTHLSATVIRVLIPSGTLIVETDDPAVKVTIEGDGGLVITGAGLHEVRLKPGSYKLQADKNGQPVPLERELVSIAKGGREVVKVKLEATVGTVTPTAEVFTPLFNGKDLTGWVSSQGGKGMWRIEDGTLTCSGPTDYLLTVRNDFADFHLRAEVKINANGNSGVYFRAGTPLAVIGDYEAQITDNPGQPFKTGSLVGLARVSQSPVPPDTWFTLEIIAEGARIRILINRAPTADYTDTRTNRPTKGHVALQHHDPETRVFFRKVEIRELPPAASVAKGAFVLLGARERQFDTLADAVYAASDGDTIEVRGNGPYVSESINCGQTALRIRAGAGFRPIIKLHPELTEDDAVFLATKVALVLEGLEFQRARSKTEEKGNRFAVHSAGAPLWAANCRFNAPVWSADAPRCVFRNCDFRGTGYGVGAQRQSGSTFIFENCLHRPGPAFQIGFSSRDVMPRDASIRISRSTFASSKASLAWTHRGPLSELTKPSDDSVGMAIDVADSIFDVQGVLGVEQGAEATVEPAAEAEAALLRLVRWRGERNLFAGTRPLLAWSKGWKLLPPHGPQTLEEWKRFWNTTESGSLEGRVQFQGGNLASRPDLDRLTPEDFRLREDSPGYRAGPDGKDLGADVDLVGPGAAYERWKQTPEYQEWLKDTGQQKDRAAAKAETGAFVVQGGTGVAERKFETLAEAVSRASAGDTIEIRGNGPFLMQPIQIRQRLTIRAGEGFRPVVRFSPGAPGDDYLLATSAPLVLEGLDIREVSKKRSQPATVGRSIIYSRAESLHLANCRLLQEQPIHQAVTLIFARSHITLRNCEFCQTAWTIVGLMNDDVPVRFEMDNCLGGLGGTAALLNYGHVGKEASLEFRNSTLVTNLAANVLFSVAPDPPPGALEEKLIRFEASGNVFDVRSGTLAFGALEPFRAKANWQKADDAEAAFTPLVGWRENRNLYAPGAAFLRWQRREGDSLPLTSGSLDDWQRRWNLTDSDSFEGTVRYQGGDLWAKAALGPEHLTPQDFRLRADSAGYRAGPEGKDLGADVDLVGPGPAYERWKKTPEYQKWLKETGQSVVRGPIYSQSYYELGNVLYAQKKPEEAARALRLGLEHDNELRQLLAQDSKPAPTTQTRVLMAFSAPRLLLVGDADNYHRLCTRMLAAFADTEEPDSAYLVARICALGPDTAPDPNRLVQLAERAVRAGPLPHYLHTLGLACYRAGRFDEAIQHLHESIAGKWNANAANWLVLAMAHQRLGHADEARNWYDKAVGWIDIPGGDALNSLHRVDFMACLVLRREAETLLGLPPRAEPEEKKEPTEQK